MVFDYLITFRKRSETTVDAISQLMYFFALIAFAYFAYINYARIYFLGFDLIILVTWIFCLVKKQRTGRVYFRFGLFIATIGWLVAPGSRVIISCTLCCCRLVRKASKISG